MELKKKQVLIPIIAFLLAINIINLVIVTTITGGVTTQGGTFICINAPPSISDIANQSATVSTTFTLQVNATDAEESPLNYYDNTTLFNISDSGEISFFPASSNIGSYTIAIIAQDNSPCSTQNGSTSFNLGIVGGVQITFTSPLASTTDATPNLDATTDINASCFYHNSSDNSYAAMSFTGATTHTQTLPSLSAGQEQLYFIQCNDSSNTASTLSLKWIIINTIANQENHTVINITANQAQTIALIPTLNITLNVSSNFINQPIAISEFNSSHLTSNFSLSGFTTQEYKYYAILVNNETISAIQNVTLTFSYNDTELAAQSISESNLRVYYYNETSTLWQQELDYGIDITANRVQANVSHLSTFILGTATVSAGGGGTNETGIGGAGGGGGGTGGAGTGKTALRSSFIVSKYTLKESLKQTQILEEQLIVSNDGEVPLSITLNSDLYPLVKVQPESLELLPGENKEVKIIFNPTANAMPEIYTGKIILESEHEGRVIQQKVQIIVEIESDELLYDLFLDVIKKNLLPQENLNLNITLFSVANQRNPTPTELTLLYSIINPENNEMLYDEKETEIIMVEGKRSITKVIPLPESIKPGQYLIAVKITYGPGTAVASELFTVQEPEKLAALVGLAAYAGTSKLIMVSFLLFLLLLVIIIVSVLKLHQRTKRNNKVIVIKKRTPINLEKWTASYEQLASLRKKITLLKESYEKGFISRNTYRSSINKIRETLNKKKHK